MRKSIQPVREHMAAIVRELLGEGASGQHITLCGRSIMAQCIHFFLHERPGRKGVGPPPMKLGVEAVADHIVRFSSAGIRDMRKRIERGEEPDDRE